MTCNNCQCKSNNEEIEDFDEDKEYAVGEFFKVENEVFKVAQTKGSECACDVCDFYSTVYCGIFNCSCFNREDYESVTAILYDTLEENE